MRPLNTIASAKEEELISYLSTYILGKSTSTEDAHELLDQGERFKETILKLQSPAVQQAYRMVRTTLSELQEMTSATGKKEEFEAICSHFGGEFSEVRSIRNVLQVFGIPFEREVLTNQLITSKFLYFRRQIPEIGSLRLLFDPNTDKSLAFDPSLPEVTVYIQVISELLTGLHDAQLDMLRNQESAKNFRSLSKEHVSELQHQLDIFHRTVDFFKMFEGYSLKVKNLSTEEETYQFDSCKTPEEDYRTFTVEREIKVKKEPHLIGVAVQFEKRMRLSFEDVEVITSHLDSVMDIMEYYLTQVQHSTEEDPLSRGRVHFETKKQQSSQKLKEQREEVNTIMEEQDLTYQQEVYATMLKRITEMEREVLALAPELKILEKDHVSHATKELRAVVMGAIHKLKNKYQPIEMQNYILDTYAKSIEEQVKDRHDSLQNMRQSDQVSYKLEEERLWTRKLHEFFVQRKELSLQMNRYQSIFEKDLKKVITLIERTGKYELSKEVCDVKSLLSEDISRLRSLHPTYRFTVIDSCNSVQVQDRLLLSIMIDNLLQNAIKHNDKRKQEVTVTLEEVMREGRPHFLLQVENAVKVVPTQIVDIINKSTCDLSALENAQSTGYGIQISKLFMSRLYKGELILQVQEHKDESRIQIGLYFPAIQLED